MFFGVELLSLIAFRSTTLGNVIVTIIAIFLLWLAWKKPFWLALLSVGELIVGGKGYLLYLTIGSVTISLRYIIFALILCAGLPLIIRGWLSLRKTVLSNVFLLFVIWLLIAVIIGLLQGHGIGRVFTDSNAFAYLALLPCWYVLFTKNENWKTYVIALLFAGVTIIGLKSWLVMLLFGKDFSFLHYLYTWIRHTGIGEITHVSGNVYRVFFQSQVYSVLVLFMLLLFWLRQRWKTWFIIPLLLSGLGVYISLSRSFWLGAALAGALLLAALIFQRAWKPLVRLWIIAPIGIFAWGMAIWAISWPYFTINTSTQIGIARIRDSIASDKTFGDSGAADASTARQNQIQPLFTAIGRHPIIGSGFGQTVTFYSTDPTSHGWRTTAAFELNYLDLWLKLGIVGILLYVLWLKKLWTNIRNTLWFEYFVYSGIALLALNMTTPYLNHPLGLGWLMLTAIFAYAI